jgi:hypothetical protein
VKARLVFLFLMAAACPALAASNAASGSWLGLGIGFGFTNVEQQIPGVGADLSDSALQFTYFNAVAQIAVTDKFALGLSSMIGSELFVPDGALRIPDKDLTFAYDMAIDGRWQYWGGSWKSAKSFTPYLITGVDFSGLPAFGRPQRPGDAYTIDRLATVSPVVGIGTGIYFSESSLQAALRVSRDFSGASHFKINRGHTLFLQMGYTFLIKSAGNIGIDLWAKRSWIDFDSVDPVTRITQDNKYMYSTWGFKGYYKFMF